MVFISVSVMVSFLVSLNFFSFVIFVVSFLAKCNSVFNLAIFIVVFVFLSIMVDVRDVLFERDFSLCEILLFRFDEVVIEEIKFFLFFFSLVIF